MIIVSLLSTVIILDNVLHVNKRLNTFFSVLIFLF